MIGGIVSKRSTALCLMYIYSGSLPIHSVEGMAAIIMVLTMYFDMQRARR